MLSEHLGDSVEQTLNIAALITDVLREGRTCEASNDQIARMLNGTTMKLNDEHFPSGKCGYTYADH